jgi:hypothetical protein
MLISLTIKNEKAYLKTRQLFAGIQFKYLAFLSSTLVENYADTAK